MKKIPREFAESIVEDVFIAIAKQKDSSSKFASQSMKLMQNPMDKQIITGVLLGKASPSLFTELEISLKNTIVDALICTVNTLEDDEQGISLINKDLLDLIKSKKDIIDCQNINKLIFASFQFATAFYEYDRLEKEYPELMVNINNI